MQRKIQNIKDGSWWWSQQGLRHCPGALGYNLGCAVCFPVLLESCLLSEPRSLTFCQICELHNSVVFIFSLAYPQSRRTITRQLLSTLRGYCSESIRAAHSPLTHQAFWYLPSKNPQQCSFLPFPELGSGLQRRFILSPFKDSTAFCHLEFFCWALGQTSNLTWDDCQSLRLLNSWLMIDSTVFRTQVFSIPNGNRESIRDLSLTAACMQS